MALRVIKVDVNSLTGHITAQVRAVILAADGTETLGPLETVGISPAALAAKFACPTGTDPCPHATAAAIRAWLKSHHDDKAAPRMQGMQVRARAASVLAGQTLTFEDVPEQPREQAATNADAATAGSIDNLPIVAAAEPAVAEDPA